MHEHYPCGSFTCCSTALQLLHLQCMQCSTLAGQCLQQLCKIVSPAVHVRCWQQQFGLSTQAALSSWCESNKAIRLHLLQHLPAAKYSALSLRSLPAEVVVCCMQAWTQEPWLSYRPCIPCKAWAAFRYSLHGSRCALLGMCLGCAPSCTDASRCQHATQSSSLPA